MKLRRIFDMAMKDLKVLSRDRLGAFFIVGFPILMGIFFGSMMGNIGGDSSAMAKMQLAIVDMDQTPMSEKFIDALGANENLELIPGELELSKESVRKGTYVGVLVLTKGFGETVGVFWGEPPELQLGLDPSRGAESAMLQGFIMQAVGSMMGERFNNPAQMRSTVSDAEQDVLNDSSITPANRENYLEVFGTINDMLESVEKLQSESESDDENLMANNTDMEFANIVPLDITRSPTPNSIESKTAKLQSKWDISFPQAMLWGVLGCIAGFSASIAKECQQGTMMRLQVAPVSKFSIVAGKGLACFLAVVFVIALMTGLGLLLGMRPGSYLNLTMAAVSVGVCFVGIMILLSTVARTGEAVNSIIWITNMVMAMLGGCMIPIVFMSGVIRQLSFLSPVRWSLVAIEGAIWRGFSFYEMLFPCSILLGVGVVSIALGSKLLARRLG